MKCVLAFIAASIITVACTEIGERNLDPTTDHRRCVWIAVKYDKVRGDYFILDPCDGHTATIQIINDSLIDDRGIDEPISFKIDQYHVMDGNTEVLEISYESDRVRLDDSIVVTPLACCKGIYKWSRHFSYNGGQKDTFVRYCVQKSHLPDVRVVVVHCPDGKLFELDSTVE